MTHAEELLREHRELEELKSAHRNAERFARMPAEARMKFKALLAEVRQHTRDEERRERQARMRGQGDLIE